MELAVHEDIVCAIFLVCRPVSVCVCFDYLENFILNTHFELEQAFLMMMLANPVLLFFLSFFSESSSFPCSPDFRKSLKTHMSNKQKLTPPKSFHL